MELALATKTAETASVEPTPALRTTVKDYMTAKLAYDRAEAALVICKTAVQEEFLNLGETHVSVDGVPLAWVCPTTSKLDQKKLIAQGVTFAQIEAATTISPGTPYLRITLPKERR